MPPRAAAPASETTRPTTTSPSAPTLAADIRREIADEILTGRLAPGARLDERGLATRYGTSRTPIREALKQLSVTGLVENRPHRGVFVSAVPQQELDEMFELAAELEAVCARLAAARMTAPERRQLETLHRQSRALVRDGDVDGYDRFNLDFHAAIFRGSHNRQLVETALAVRARVTPFRRAQFRMPARLASSFAEHDAIVLAILRGAAEEAALRMREHILSSKRSSAAYLNL
ncbi:GntR family transcriptional regulator [Arenibaculum pallidiluteum]|uniref:GntR family transcriptional regulator n=1 Tax=Arenibaculum pallidiluteum TaxID=2812559 RepID=UPI001A962C90|nr:GntR family transcriptional regulator [Arenibaculum pallidiluteum]